MVAKKHILAKRYGKESKKYESVRFGTPGGKAIESMEREIVRRLAGNVKNRKILDVATGTGRFAIDLAKRGATVYATDLSDKMLQIAKQKAKKSKVKIVFKKADIEKLPYSDKKFDAVIGIRIIMHLNDYKKALGEMKRVCKEDGYIIFEITNKYNIWTLLNNLFRFGIAEISKTHKKHRAKTYSYSEIKEFLAKNNMFIEKTYGLFWVPETLFYKCPKGLLMLILKLENILRDIMPGYLGERIFIKAKLIK